jgi:hypothetical protein
MQQLWICDEFFSVSNIFLTSFLLLTEFHTFPCMENVGHFSRFSMMTENPKEQFSYILHLPLMKYM